MSGIDIPDAPALPGLAFRQFRDEADYPPIVALINACHQADQIEIVETVENLTRYYGSLEQFSPYRDLLLVELESQLIGYCQMEWATDIEGVQFYFHTSYLLPEWRGKGLGRALLHYNERQLHAIAATQPAATSRFFEVSTTDTELATEKLLQRAGYTPGRYFYKMRALPLDDMSPAQLPPGLEIRPAQPEHYRAIWEANDEAFHDHWSHLPATEAHYQAWLQEPNFNSRLWQIAWAGDQVAGVAVNLIIATEKAESGDPHGEVRYLSVRRPWRRQGLARALLVGSLHTLKAQGVTEVFLFVDAENWSGALRLYESVGFQVIKRFTAYQKPL